LPGHFRRRASQFGWPGGCRGRLRGQDLRPPFQPGPRSPVSTWSGSCSSKAAGSMSGRQATYYATGPVLDARGRPR